MKQCNMYDFQSRINEENAIISQILRDMTNVYKLEPGCKYHVQLIDGKDFDGYFKRLKVSCYRNVITIWVAFYKVKKDGTASMVETGSHSENIQDITNI